eukprot:273317_1
MQRFSKLLSRHNSSLLPKISIRCNQTHDKGDNKIHEWKHKLSSLLKKIDHTETSKLYNAWANDYDESVQEWGYIIPSVMGNLVKTHLNIDKQNKQFKMFDLGCGTGLIGHELITKHSEINIEIFGCDLSKEQFNITKNKGYTDLKQWNLNDYPFPYKDNQFDIITCGGTLTYCNDKSSLFNEWFRISNNESIIICSHREDLMNDDLKYFEQMENNGKWLRLEITDPFVYLPKNDNYGTDILVQCYVAKTNKLQS